MNAATLRTRALARPFVLDGRTWAIPGTLALIPLALPFLVPELQQRVNSVLRPLTSDQATSSVIALYVGVALGVLAVFALASIVAEALGVRWLARRWTPRAGHVATEHALGALTTFSAMMCLTPLGGHWLLVPASREWPVALDYEGALTRDGQRLLWRDVTQVVEVRSQGGYTSAYVVLFAGGRRLIVNFRALNNVTPVENLLRQLRIIQA